MIKRSLLFPVLSCDLIKKAERSDGPGPACQRGRASHAGASLCVVLPGFSMCVCIGVRVLRAWRSDNNEAGKE